MCSEEAGGDGAGFGGKPQRPGAEQGLDMSETVLRLRL